MSLTKERRDALPEGEFAVPEKRALPIHDATHVKMAWKMIDKTHGLSDEEKKTARSKILNKAHQLGVDTEDWHTQAMQFEAMAIEMPDVEDHPNKLNFSGILTRLDQPSDAPLNGSNGKLVILPKTVAEKALPSLLGMAVDFTPHLDGHDAKKKIGLITEATIQGNAIHIAGFFYSADFPTEVKNIQAQKAKLGFSYEAQSRVRSMNDDILVIDYCVFTGAAVLQKNKAAYTTTNLEAKAEKIIMSEEVKNEILEKLEAMSKEIADLKEAQKNQVGKLEASSVMNIVKPHADGLRSCAAGMAAAGLGMHPKGGHVAALHNMADHMEAEAASGKLPHVYQNDSWMSAAAEKKEDTQEENKKMEAFQSVVDGLKTEISDLKKSKFEAAKEPERKTMQPQMLTLLAKTGLKPSDDEKISIATLDEHLQKSSIGRVQSIQLKNSLKEANLI